MLHNDSIARAFDCQAILAGAEALCSRRRKAPTGNVGYDLHQYDGIACDWQCPGDLPHGRMEKALLKHGLGDCTGLRILQLAGGTGEHARRAVEAGAGRVDVVDISQPMMEIGKKIEAEAGRESLHWYCADAARALWQQVPELPIQGYDVVLAMWPFDFAETVEELVGVWRNVAAYLKPGGRLMGARVLNPWSRCVHDGKYGARATLIEQTPTRAVKCQVLVNTHPPFSFWSCSTEASLRGGPSIPNRLGIIELQILDPAETDLVREDPSFWKDLIEDPYFVVFTGRKLAPALQSKMSA